MTAEQLALFANYGVLGLFTVLWLTDRIHTKSRTDRAEAIADKALDGMERVTAAIEKLTTAVEAWRMLERREKTREGPG